MAARRPVSAPTFRFAPRREKRPWGWFGLSVFLHVLIIVLAVVDLTKPEPFDVDTRTPGGPGPAGGGGGGGWERVTYITMPAYQAPAKPKEESKRPRFEDIVIPKPEMAKLDIPVDTVQFDLSQTDRVVVGGPVQGRGAGTGGGPGSGTGSGGGIGSGRGTGVGSGTGPGTGGNGGDIFPPAPRYTILPPQPVPNSDKGRTFQAKITVAADGRVLDVKVRPQIRDRNYRRRFEEQLYQWAFAPAVTREGTPVRGELVVTITL